MFLYISSITTGVIFCRVILNSQTAIAHQHVFQEIEEIVFKDTGARLRWRHIHGIALDDYEGMILSFTVDQHRGQAKGGSSIAASCVN